MANIEAPFTPEQVKKLKQWQSGMLPLKEGETDPVAKQIGGYPVHPFTCCSHNGCERDKREDQGELIPTLLGWTCPCGVYKQYWCHDFMVE